MRHWHFQSRFALRLIAALNLLVCFAVSAAEPPFSSGRLWRISRTGLPDSYALGTIHIADQRVSTITRPIREALAHSRTLAVELVPESADSRTAEYEQMEDGRRLDALLEPESYAQLQDRLGRTISGADLERMKPWAAMLKLGRSAADAGTGNPVSLDAQLFVAARERRLKILPLELLEEQVAAFDTIPLVSQVALLEHVLANRDALAASNEQSINAWLRGDLDGLARVSVSAFDVSPAMREHHGQLVRNIIVGRTALMHHRLYLPLRTGRVLIAIGAMHLYGEQGLLALLVRDGYRITRFD